MLTIKLDCGSRGPPVGYSSAAQFSREYGRFFGSAPAKDVNRLREEGLVSGDSAERPTFSVVLFRRQSRGWHLDHYRLPATKLLSRARTQPPQSLNG